MYVICLLISKCFLNILITFLSINRTLTQQKHKKFAIPVSYFLEVFHSEILVSSSYITSLISLKKESEFRRLYFILTQNPPPTPLFEIFTLS